MGRQVRDWQLIGGSMAGVCGGVVLGFLLIGVLEAPLRYGLLQGDSLGYMAMMLQIFLPLCAYAGSAVGVWAALGGSLARKDVVLKLAGIYVALWGLPMLLVVFPWALGSTDVTIAQLGMAGVGMLSSYGMQALVCAGLPVVMYRVSSGGALDAQCDE